MSTLIMGWMVSGVLKKALHSPVPTNGHWLKDLPGVAGDELLPILATSVFVLGASTQALLIGFRASDLRQATWLPKGLFLTMLAFPAAVAVLVLVMFVWWWRPLSEWYRRLLRGRPAMLQPAEPPAFQPDPRFVPSYGQRVHWDGERDAFLRLETARILGRGFLTANERPLRYYVHQVLGLIKQDPLSAEEYQFLGMELRKRIRTAMTEAGLQNACDSTTVRLLCSTAMLQYAEWSSLRR